MGANRGPWFFAPHLGHKSVTKLGQIFIASTPTKKHSGPIYKGPLQVGYVLRNHNETTAAWRSSIGYATNSLLLLLPSLSFRRWKKRILASFSTQSAKRKQKYKSSRDNVVHGAKCFAPSFVTLFWGKILGKLIWPGSRHFVNSSILKRSQIQGSSLLSHLSEPKNWPSVVAAW